MTWLAWLGLAQATPPAVVPHRTARTVAVDGVLDEPAWAEAPVLTDLVQLNPQAGGPEFGTTVRVLVDDQALIFGFEVATVPETPLNAPLVPRDSSTFHNWIGVVLDTYGDGQRGFVFRTSASGVQADAIMSANNSGLWMMDMAWDGVYQSAAQPLESGDGYTAELRIPFRSLRYAPGEGQTWGLLVVHFTPTPWALFTWPAMNKEEAGLLEQGARLGPFDPPRPRMPFEVLPTLTGKVERLPEQHTSLDPGLNLKAGLTSGLTLDLALNQDFSEVEADFSQLQRNRKYLIYLEEKRPFFLEGVDYFETPIDIFYSRSVVDPLVSLRLTGRVGPVPVGVLAAWDQAPAPSTLSWDRATGDEREAVWTPADVADARSLVLLGRTGLELDNGTRVGLLAADKTLVTDGGERLQNTVSGVDATAQVAERWTLTGQALTSHTTTAEDDVLTGTAWIGRIQRSSETFYLGARQSFLGPDFRAETGFLTEVDRVGASVWGGHTLFTPPFRFLTMGIDADATFTTAGEPVELQVETSAEALIGERTYIEAEVGIRQERFKSQDFRLVTSRGFGGLNPTARSFVGVSWKLGQGIDYEAPVPYRGFETEGGVFLEGSLFGRLRLDYDGIAWAFWGGHAEPVYSTLINRLDITLFLTPELSVRWLVQHDSDEAELQSSALITWQLNYGTAAYLGYQEVVDTAAFASTERLIFAKVGVLYRPGEPIFPGLQRVER